MEVMIRDESLAGRETGSMGLDVPELITLRELIRLRVREEVARFNARPTGRFTGLIRPRGATGQAGGYSPAGPIDWERQAEAALAAFVRNGFIVLVGDRQIEDLDEPLRLDEASDVRFVRLVPLVGG